MPAVPECVIVLASASPRRRRLIDWLGLPVVLMAVDTPEDLTSELAGQPGLLAAHLAAEKASAARDERVLASEDVVVAFDTIVVLDGAVLGKPLDVADAWRMLRALSGREHEVVTGVALLASDMREPRAFSVTTSVRMKPLGDCQIEAWMALGEFLGCAGAYNIEGQVAEVDADECYQNVAGLPLCHLRRALAQSDLPCDLRALSSPAEACDTALRRQCRLAPLLSPAGL
jgi:septum formation protein